MKATPLTRPSLLVRIRNNGDQQAWNEFVEIYAPLIHAFGMKRGFQDADAADLAQDVISTVVRTIGRFEYERGRGSFRGWLYTVTLNRIRRLATLKKRQPNGTGDSGVHAVLSQEPERQSEDEWNRRHRQRLFHWAADQARANVKKTTWEAFWRTAVLNRPPADVATELGVTVGTVYLAKTRMIARIRDYVSQIESPLERPDTP